MIGMTCVQMLEFEDLRVQRVMPSKIHKNENNQK